MPRKPLADLPGHARFDAGLRDLASLATKLSEEAGAKSARAGSIQEQQMFAALADRLNETCASAKDMRHTLWQVVG